MRVAVVGIGSNSVRMLLADVQNNTFTRILRDREGTRLFAGLDEKGNLSQESMQRTAGAAARMVGKARASGAEKIHLFATSASRDANNGSEFIDMVRNLTGEPLAVISGCEEADLSFLGATEGRDTLCGVIDIGGGSTEVVVGNRKELFRSFSCQMGAVRLFNMIPIHSDQDLPEVIGAARRILLATMDGRPLDRMPETWIGTGGTFTTLAAMVKEISWTERTYMHGTVLPYARIAGLAAELANMSMEERLKHPGLQPGRADIVVHGICILLAIMNEFSFESIAVSEYGNLDGFIRREYLH